MSPMALYIIAAFVILALWQYLDRAKVVVPLRYYPAIFAVPVAMYVINKNNCFDFNLLSHLLGDSPSKGSYLMLICIWVSFVHIVIKAMNSFVHIAIKAMNSSKSEQSKSVIETQNRGNDETQNRGNDETRNQGNKKAIVALRIIHALRRAIRIVLNVITASVVLLLIYTELFNANNKGGTSSDSLAILTAVLALSAALYGTQRTLKQESTKNRQDWITSVRFEAANLIAIVDKIKLYNRLQRQSDAYSYAEQITELCMSLLDSCAKLRLLLNPKDLLAPILIAQLDAITNYAITAANNSLAIKDENDSKNIKDRTLSFYEINLRKSFIPLVQVLLKVEWERVKDILESKEESSEGYYSKDIYMERWEETDLYKYGVDVKAIAHAIKISDDKNNTKTKSM